MNRRSFTIGLTTIGLSSCQFLPQSNKTNIELLLGSVPNKLIKDFQKIYKISLNPKLHKNYTDLSNNFDQSSTAILGIGDSWLGSIVSSLQKIDPTQVTNLKFIPSPWQTVGTINNNLYAIPYRWGTTVIAYNQQKFEQQNIPPITSWADLWHPKLKRKISLPDSDREVIGLCLKKRGLSYNEPEITNISQLKEDLYTIDRQVLTYTSNHYIQALINEDTWVAVGWSGEFQEIIKRYPKIKIIHPKEGTSLWFDCWAIPQNLTNPAIAYKWINYSIEPEISEKITLLTKNNGITNSQNLLSEDYLKLCEPIFPLKYDQVYQEIWQQLRQKT